MHTTITLNQARLKLHIGKDRLRKLLEDCGIEARVTGRQRKVISPAQLEHLRNIVEGQQPISRYLCNSEGVPTGPAETGLETSRTSLGLVEDRLECNDQSRIRLAVLEAQVDSLSEQLIKTETRLGTTETLLQEEKEDRRRKDAEVAEQTINFQKMVQFLQQDNQQLRQQLLEAPKPSRFDVDAANTEVEDRVDVKTPSELGRLAEPANDATRNKTAWAFGIGIGAVAAVVVLYVVVATSEQGTKWFPSMHEKVRDALQLTDSGSIVPYRYEDGGLR
jgi:vacuolar-type H+-ATPase subunit I/STV1